LQTSWVFLKHLGKLLSYWDLQSLWTYTSWVFSSGQGGLREWRWGLLACIYCKTGIWFACTPHFGGVVVNA
jgi:hypothetical protein